MRTFLNIGQGKDFLLQVEQGRLKENTDISKAEIARLEELLKEEKENTASLTETMNSLREEVSSNHYP